MHSKGEDFIIWVTGEQLHCILEMNVSLYFNDSPIKKNVKGINGRKYL